MRMILSVKINQNNVDFSKSKFYLIINISRFILMKNVFISRFYYIIY